LVSDKLVETFVTHAV